jgi:hypothetical protein
MLYQVPCCIKAFSRQAVDRGALVCGTRTIAGADTNIPQNPGAQKSVPATCHPEPQHTKIACRIHNLECAARELLRCSKGQSELPHISIDFTIITGPSFASPFCEAWDSKLFSLLFEIRDYEMLIMRPDLLPKGQRQRCRYDNEAPLGATRG